MKNRIMCGTWIARGLVGVVFILNVQSAVVFLVSPDLYISAFELSGEVGEVTLRGIGILFLMWNVPYFFAFLHPYKHSLSLLQANLMQFIGFLGESILLMSMDNTYGLLASSIRRFVLFDGIGLVLLILAGLIVCNQRRL